MCRCTFAPACSQMSTKMFIDILRSDPHYGAFTNIGGTDIEDVIYNW